MFSRGSKSEIRARMRRLRRELPASEVARAGGMAGGRLLSLPEWSAARAVLVYRPTENELPVSAVVEAAQASGKTLFLPGFWSAEPGVGEWAEGDCLEPGLGQTRQPRQPSERWSGNGRLALVPLVAWDGAANRLGRGGGFYDRLFADPAERGGVTLIGWGYEFQRVESFPRDPWDVPMDFVISERRIVRRSG